MTTLSTPGLSGVSGTPQVSWNLDPRTAIEASVYFREVNRPSSRLQHRLGFIQVKRTLFTSGTSSLFAVAGGTSGTHRTTSPGFTYTSGGRLIIVPSRTQSRGIGGFVTGAGYERVVASRLKLAVEGQMIVGGDAPMFRTLVGVSTPIGRYRRPTRASSPSSLGNVDVGRMVWVTMREGATWKGTVARVDSSAIVIERDGAMTSLSLADVHRVEAPDVIGDGIGRGALIGAAAAGVPATLLIAALCHEVGSCEGYAFLFGVAWAGVGAGVGAVTGALVDSFHEGRRTVYESGRPRVTIAPMIAKRSAGVGAVIRW
jgi:hypothetical protein